MSAFKLLNYFKGIPLSNPPSPRNREKNSNRPPQNFLIGFLFILMKIGSNHITHTWNCKIIWNNWNNLDIPAHYILNGISLGPRRKINRMEIKTMVILATRIWQRFTEPTGLSRIIYDMYKVKQSIIMR